jgi:phytanoyl-CoA hydroxylase
MEDIDFSKAKAFYSENGYLIFSSLISNSLVRSIQSKFSSLFCGYFETGIFPDEWTWRPSIGLPTATREIVNAWKCDREIASLVLSPKLGQFIATLMNWPGARIAQDDLWWKLPQNKAIAFHQDATYMTSIEPNDVVTLWIALDDTYKNAGTLEYVPGSHLWDSDLIREIPKQFFSPTNYKETLEHIAQKLHMKPDILPIEVPMGGGSLHHGMLFHGSGANKSNVLQRRSIAIHYVRNDAHFSDQYPATYIYGRYKLFGSLEMKEDFFPIVWSSNGYRTNFIQDWCPEAPVNIKLKNT